MKKIILTLILAIPFVAFGQISIDADDLPQAGTAYILGSVNNPGIDISASSQTAQNWDFSGIQSTMTKFAVYSSTQPYHQYKDDFANANLYTYGPAFLFSGFFGGAPVDQTEWGYAYWNSDADGFKVIGFRGDYGFGDENVYEDPSELLMGVPATLNSTFTDTSRWSIQVDRDLTDGTDSIYVSTVQKTIEVDAFGTLTTDFGTFDVIRAHEYFIGIDSLIYSTALGSYAYVMYDTLHNYYFWADSIGFPIASIYCDSVNDPTNLEFISNTFPSWPIMGRVLQPDGVNPMTSGNVSLIARDSIDHLFGINEEVTVDDDGYFQFSFLTGGNWMIHVNPDNAMYPACIPTYFGDMVSWVCAPAIEMSQDTIITIILNNDHSGIYDTGQGQIQGTIFDNTSSNKNQTPAENIKVILNTVGDTIPVLFKHTDENGNFNFSNVSNGDYLLDVDIAGLHMDTTLTITISNDVLTVEQLDYVYDTTTIQYIGTSGVKEIYNAENNRFKIKIDQQSDLIKINDSKEFSNFDIEVFDLNGRMVDFLSGNEYEAVINTNDYKQGIYNIIINEDGILYRYKIPVF
jgi:hypothetical protein